MDAGNLDNLGCIQRWSEDLGPRGRVDFEHARVVGPGTPELPDEGEPDVPPDKSYVRADPDLWHQVVARVDALKAERGCR